SAYEQIMQKFPNHELFGQAVFERARVVALQGDINGAMNELRRFTSDQKLKGSTVAPMALLRLATMMRSQNQAAQAADILDKGRSSRTTACRPTTPPTNCWPSPARNPSTTPTTARSSTKA